MPVRTGAQYIKSLQDEREVWIDGERVGDVTTHPAFRGCITTVAALYDMQHGSLQNKMTYASPSTGDPVGLSFLIPKNKKDFHRRRGMMTLWAQATVGMMGRSPDYVNVSIAAMAAAAEYFGRNRPEFANNIWKYYERIRENDLVVSHALLNPSHIGDQITLVEEPALRLIEETSEGIIISGSRKLDTSGATANEIILYPTFRLETNDMYALALALPCNTPGLKFVCRESFNYGGSRADHPLASRFEEMDAVVFFDNVFVPKNRIFLLGDVALYNQMAQETHYVTHSDDQTSVRQNAKTEFLLGIASLIVKTLGLDKDPTVQEQLGEMVGYLVTMKSLLQTAEENATTNKWGVYTPDVMPLVTARSMFARDFYPHIMEIIRLLSSSSLMTLPSMTSFDTVLKPELEKYLATGTMTAQERIRLLHLVSDIACSAFGAREEHYERHFAGPPMRNAQALERMFDRGPVEDFVLKFLARTD